MQDTWLQNEPMPDPIAASIEEKPSHKMLRTNWIILYDTLEQYILFIIFTSSKVRIQQNYVAAAKSQYEYLEYLYLELWRALHGLWGEMFMSYIIHA